MRRALLVVLAAVGLAVVPAGAASAHPLGNFTVNTADRLVVTEDGVAVTHVVDLAEIPTVQLGQARAGVDTDRDGTLSAGELDAHAAAECARIAPQLSLQVDGSAVPLSVVSSTGEKFAGTAGLATARLTCDLLGEQRPQESVVFTDPVAPERNGWREVTAASECGPLSGSTVPSTSPSGLLSQYPEDLLSAPVDVTTASFSVSSGAACTAGLSTTGATADEIAPRGVDGITSRFTGFLSRPDLTVPFALLSLGAAVLFGVLHAMAPGHGKTVMAAYLVGQRGTRRQALQLGAVVTFTHTASVLALGGVLALGALAAPELVVPVTEVLSGVLLGVVGVYLAVLAVRRLRATGDHSHDGDHDHDHPQDHEHPHPHPHDHELPHDHPHPHDHEHPHPHDHELPHDHDHDHDHDHPHDHDQPHPHPHPHSPAAVADLGGAATPGAGSGATKITVPVGTGGGVAVAVRPTAHSPVAHSHGGRMHTHAPLPEGPMSWKALAGMGVAGGLVPSPSALLVLLSASALGRPVFGVLLVLAYGVGMAVTLTAAGLLLLRARAVLDRRGWTGGRAASLVRLLPLGTAAVVVLVGLGLVLRGIGTGRGLL